MNKLIGRVLATEKTPTTMDNFNFWTDANLQLHAFDIVKVEHIDKSFTFGVIGVCQDSCRMNLKYDLRI